MPKLYAGVVRPYKILLYIESALMGITFSGRTKHKKNVNMKADD